MPISSKIYDLTLGTVAENGNGCGNGCGYFFIEILVTQINGT